MKIVTNGRNIELTEAIKHYVQQKLSRLENHFDFIQEIHVILEVEKNPRIQKNHLAEATLHVPGAVIRVEAATENLYASIDALADKIERAIRKYKTKLKNRAVGQHETIRKESVEEEADLGAMAVDDADDDLQLEILLEDEIDLTVAETHST